MSASNPVEPLTLFEKAERIFPKRVFGRFRNLKWVSMIVLLAIYYLVPFIRWDRGEFAPGQAVLIDLPNSRAYFFWFEIWPQEVYILTGILVFAAVALFFVTSLFGRVWCGYACPQTVWTDLYTWVERIVQGDRTQRMRLAKAKWSLSKIWKLVLTNILWLIIGLFTGGAWVLYFNDAPTLLGQVVAFDVPWSVMVWVFGLTLSTWFMAGYARENVCTYYCPYSRFQSAMFDRDSMIIGYDEVRGEKRGKHKKGESWDGRGHCIDCHQCVDVCPMGIDIRDGLQMQCIACGLCIDACDNIMDKLELPRGLVRYDTVHNQQARQAGQPEINHLIRPRTIYYTLILSVVGGLILYGLLGRTEHELHVLHDRNPLFVQLSSGDIRNGYDVKILNKTHQDQEYRISIEGLAGASMRLQGAGQLEPSGVPVFADSVGHFRMFISAPKQNQERVEVTVVIETADGQSTDRYKTKFVSGGPR